ncbi:hypothetical protein ACFOMD_09035 [Sphingoaurantiacus capsulatus]|uniref:Uncharacterized protein n=1 Tax=Sphingoaurantiacus capsulatus TaxID=1771310 RepID=A0ABV7XBR8_9SPHN
MDTKPFGTLRHRSFPYFLLRAGLVLAAALLSVALRLLLPRPFTGGGFWSDFGQGALVTITLVPLVLAAIYGGRLIRRGWTVLPR